MAKKTTQHVTITEGNKKLGRHIPNVSLDYRTCPANVPCRRDCYAQKAWKAYPSTRAAWTKNADLLQADRPRFFFEILENLRARKRRPARFRWHVAGDIPDQDYLARMAAIAVLLPDIRFMAFTKNHSLDFSGLPVNLSIVLSMWPGMYLPAGELPIAWFQDGTETRIPPKTFGCPGSCERCEHCWSGEGDVVFLKH